MVVVIWPRRGAALGPCEGGRAAASLLVTATPAADWQLLAGRLRSSTRTAARRFTPVHVVDRGLRMAGL